MLTQELTFFLILQWWCIPVPSVRLQKSLSQFCMPVDKDARSAANNRGPGFTKPMDSITTSHCILHPA